MAKSERILCISDLHLNDQQPEIFHAFKVFMQEQASKAQALYILGDFFNIWIGDDDPADFTAKVKQELLTLANSGTKIYLMHGNRDFLLGSSFCNFCQVQLINEPFVLECFGSSYLLIHGDSLCTRDVGYMDFRTMVRNPVWQQDFLSKSLTERRSFADQARQQSKAMSSNKPEDIMDVSSEEVVSLMQEYKQEILVHGHTHRPNIHAVDLEAGKGKRIVLGDWGQSGWYLELSPEGHELISFAIQA